MEKGELAEKEELVEPDNVAQALPVLLQPLEEEKTELVPKPKLLVAWPEADVLPLQSSPKLAAVRAVPDWP